MQVGPDRATAPGPEGERRVPTKRLMTAKCLLAARGLEYILQADLGRVATAVVSSPNPPSLQAGYPELSDSGVGIVQWT